MWRNNRYLPSFSAKYPAFTPPTIPPIAHIDTIIAHNKVIFDCTMEWPVLRISVSLRNCSIFYKVIYVIYLHKKIFHINKTENCKTIKAY